jgi:CheY-like chemotaxis protein
MADRPDLILLDINMPDMDGYQVLGILKADPRMRAVPIIALTANAMARDVERGLQAGFAQYLTKPVDVRVLLKSLDDCLQQRDGVTP